MSSYNKEADKKYYETHKEQRNEQSKRYYEEHKDELKEYRKKYYEEHSESLKEQSKKYYREHADHLCLIQKEKIDNMPHKDKETYLEYHRKYYQEHKKELYEGAKRRRKETNRISEIKSYYKNKYGITYEEYLSLSEKQGNKCAICGKEEVAKQNGKTKRLAVDHDHKTGFVRGLLCCHCNITLGGYKDNKEIYRNAFEYLDRAEKQQYYLEIT